MAKLKKIPSGEVIQVTNTNTKKEVFVITKAVSSGLFYLYRKNSDSTYEKLDKGRKNPLEFDPLIW